ncbi:hypothetical protein KGF57_003483 [Candida theae]|uniref:Glycoside hydrolase family 125 protein n=1 Tax=Candida theae TaxID=1198502 RepID=A0AAD5BDR4_9ASCO|nr:uncharacterized protein KGF57_003483 [Candida theae]KAI5955997.1 hypothetical protein KGF57_003483 [Candida theae]
MIPQSRIHNYIKLLVALISLLILCSLFTRHKSTTTPNDKLTSPVDEINYLQAAQENKAAKLAGHSPSASHLDTRDIDQSILQQMDSKIKQCPDYVTYSQHRHAPYSKGVQHYPYMRPAPKCRTFVSQAVESVIDELKTRIADSDLARLVENCLPNTLDTTILWHKVNNDGGKQNPLRKPFLPQSFIVTGDIHAEWLRDAARQLSVYQPLVRHDDKLRQLILGAINTQAYYVNNSPYCNAFHPPPTSKVKPGNTAFDNVYPRPDWRQVFECKYEIDSLASFLTLTNEYYQNSGGDTSFLNDYWFMAYEKLLIVLRRESEPSFDEASGQALPFYYSFQRDTNIGSETLPLGGVGNPVNFGTGLIRSAFRPSDDATILQFFIPGNIHMLTELINLRKNFLNEEVLSNRMNAEIEVFIKKTDYFIKGLTSGIEKFGIVNHPIYGKVYAYEVDGYGSATFMDDANIPSLLSIPDLGYTDKTDQVYQNTRKMILTKEGNPYYLKGFHFEGIGGPHIGIKNAWPMSLLMRMRTTDDDEEIINSLHLIMNNTAGSGLMHESVNVNSKHGASYTRSWFAWCNSEFGKTILHLAEKKPHLIFKEEWKAQPFKVDDVFRGV